MLAALRLRWRAAVRGFWFVPASVAALFLALAFVLLAVDEVAGDRGVDFAFEGDADAARQILAIIAGSLITVAGVSFSITIVTLQLVSTQYTPRALRTFLKDRTNQLTAGAFVGVFLYCLVVLRAVRDDSDRSEAFVPSLSVTTGIALAALGLALLLVFIHHMGESIKVSSIAARIARDSLNAVDDLYRRPYERERARPGVGRERSGRPIVTRADRPGYVQAIDVGSVARALPEGATVELKVSAGEFVDDGAPLAAVWPGEAAVDGLVRATRRAVRIDDDRDIRQDVAYGVRQLVDIGLRALSPGVNDPTTAVNCIRYLQSVVARLAGRSLEPDLGNADTPGLLVAPATPFSSYVEQAFLELSRYGARDARVVDVLLDALAAVAEAARAAGAGERIEAVSAVAEAVAAPALEDARTEYDRTLIGERLARLRSAVAALEPPPGAHAQETGRLGTPADERPSE